MKTLVFALAVLCGQALAAPTGFAERARFGSGAAIVEPAAGGEYVHGRQVADSRVRTTPVLVQVPQRQAYVFFSPEEELALLNFRDQQLAVRIKERVVASRQRHHRATANFNWPKVVVRAEEICVPELASSEAADWRDHLVCHREGALR